MTSRYDIFLQERIFRDCIYLIESLDESSSIDKIKNVWIKIIDRVSKLSKVSRKKVLGDFIASAMTVAPISAVIRMILDDSSSEIKNEVVESIDDMGFFDPVNMRLSQKGRDLIKEHEGFRSKAYKIGDGMITIGWGHAEPINKSKYRVGQEISHSEASLLLTGDLTDAADGVRRMFGDWKKSGDYVPVSQDMFDALVSLAYNGGVSGLRNSDLAKQLRKKNYEKCGELIKTFKISKKFKGLSKRRQLESKLFLSFM
jgi:lysozyme